MYNVPEPVIYTIGTIGLLLSLSYRLPQIWHTYKLKKADQISVWTLSIQTTSYFIYIVYGVLIGDWVYIVSSALCIIQNMIIHGMRIYYDKQNKEQLLAVESQLEDGL